MAFSCGLEPIFAKQQQYITQYDDMDDQYLKQVDGRDLQQGSQVGTTTDTTAALSEVCLPQALSSTRLSVLARTRHGEHAFSHRKSPAFVGHAYLWHSTIPGSLPLAGCRFSLHRAGVSCSMTILLPRHQMAA